MANTSCSEIAGRVLAACLAGDRWSDDDVRRLAADDCVPELFRVVAEGLGDAFEPAMADLYAEIFAQVFAEADGALDARSLLDRYERVRVPRCYSGDPERIYVLSRVTLGADVAITSLLISAARARFPDAEIWFAGPRKNYELFNGGPALKHLEIPYRRGSVQERLEPWRQLSAALEGQSRTLVIDPDSRLTQLGLLPVCPEEQYLFFESRAFQRDSHTNLTTLTDFWAQETMGAAGEPYSSPAEKPEPGTTSYVTVSLGVGENSAKRLSTEFEARLLALLATRGDPIWIDAGAGGDEERRVRQAIEKSSVPASFFRVWEGSFAGFSALIAGSKLYTGYDSAGQHVAAAAAVPLISIFAGFPNDRFFERWAPTDSGDVHVLRVDKGAEAETVLQRVERIIR